MAEPCTVSAKFTIANELGLHVRASAMIVRTAAKFESSVSVAAGSVDADAQSVLELLTLAASRGTVVTVTATGEDAQAVVTALGELIGRNFAE